MAGLQVTNINGVLPVVSLKDLQEQERREAQAANTQPLVQGLAAYVRQCFNAAREAREKDAEKRMLQGLRQRRGEYDPEKLSDIRQMGGSEIYMMLTSNKCRAAASWLRDTLLGARDEKPWVIEPTALPELTPEDMQRLQAEATQEIMQMEMMLGTLTPENVRQVALRVRDEAISRLQDQARQTMDRMEQKMEDQLQEGGFSKALSQFIDDLTTFPSAVMKGPVIRKQRRLAWVNGAIEVQEKLTENWERVDPLMVYPSPHASTVDDGYLIERHRLTRQAINSLIGVPGYNDAALRQVLDEYGRGGLNQWLSVDQMRADAEGKTTVQTSASPEVTIDALQFWGSVPGKMLEEWGFNGEEQIEPTTDYECEVWLIGNWVVKATLNPDELGRKPYFKTSYEEIPGVFWGNSVADLVRDCQDMCNAAARALSNNMGISSGPQVWVNNERLADGETITQLYPWKIWQTKGDPYGSNTAPPLDFFQPNSNANELMGIYDRFSTLADEFSGVPRYMTGDASVGGAGRTASGMSMLMGNAGKAIKQVLNNVDANVLGPLIERLYYHNMRFGEDPDLKGDVRVIAHGANALVVKEQAQVRRNEFLNLVLSNPLVAQIVGEEAIADLLREGAKGLDMNAGRIVPSSEKIRARMAMQQMAALQQMQGPQVMPGQGQTLTDGSAVTDNFAPMRG